MVSNPWESPFPQSSSSAARTVLLQGTRRRFESCLDYHFHGGCSSMVEHLTVNQVTADRYRSVTPFHRRLAQLEEHLLDM